MKKIILFFTFSVVILVFTSCNKCRTCTKQGSTGGTNGTMKVCKDGMTNEEFHDHLEYLETERDYDCYNGVTGQDWEP